MKIDKTFKIKEKYFNAILTFEKPFELRHEKVKPNSIVKLECENGRYIIFKSGECYEIEKGYSTTGINNGKEALYHFYDVFIDFNNKASFEKRIEKEKEKITYFVKYYSNGFCGQFSCEWFDDFCWNYIIEAPTYLIEIAEILEVK